MSRRGEDTPGACEGKVAAVRAGVWPVTLVFEVVELCTKSRFLGKEWR